MANNHAEFAIPEIESDDQVQELKSELEELEGVQLVSFDREKGLVDVRYGVELIAEEQIKSAVRDAGYEVE